MKAIRVHEFGDPSVLKLEQIPDPVPGPGQVVIQAKAVGVNPVDTYIRAGAYGERPKPFTPGMDAAGLVDSVGQGVKRTKGERVWIYGSLSGAYAEKILCAETQLHPLPDDLSFAQGAALGVPFSTAAYALTVRTQVKKGETVLIHGASGGVGTAAVQLAKSLGLVVYGTAGTKEGLKLVRDQGADQVFNHREAGYLESVKQKTEGRGVDLILEMLANVNLAEDLKVLAKNGRVVVIGSRGPISIDPRDTMSRNTSILGMTILNATPFELASVSTRLEKLLSEKALKPVVRQEFPLADAAKAHEAVMAPGALGKFVLLP